MRRLLFKALSILLILLISFSSVYADTEQHDNSICIDENSTACFKPIGEMPISHQFYLMQMAEKYNFKPSFLAAVINLESRFDYKAIGYNKKDGVIVSRDRGYFQINSKYEHWYAEMAELDEYDVFNPYHSIKMGVAGLNYYRERAIKAGYTNEKEILKYTLNSYNMGEQGYKNYIKRTGTMDRAYSNIILEREVQYRTYMEIY